MPMTTNLDHPFGQQDEFEIEWLCQFIGGAKSILEIGSCFGQSLRMFADLAEPNARIRSIDLGYGTHSLNGVDTGAILSRRIRQLRAKGFDARVLFSDSKSREARLWAAQEGPYDFIFIDGDHDYLGVRSDWENYGPLGKIVAFHDIAYEGHDVKRLWAEIKRAGYCTDERVLSRMGIGVVFQ